MESYHPDVDMHRRFATEAISKETARFETDVQYWPQCFLRLLPVPEKMPPSILNGRQRKSGGKPNVMESWG
ncbi:hypothetical protein CEXT_415551 [Caerostris extrusa]|uniref:Uncharacterized protein n=1 Tax=Caerostris extrusa TaxID=172846 RepID=A0AAV4N669_CAEEX|nr:hypothetical protein CEXT_415551 [Caerostris extrusa]